jgi:hypothetical protein
VGGVKCERGEVGGERDDFEANIDHRDISSIQKSQIKEMTNDIFERHEKKQGETQTIIERKIKRLFFLSTPIFSIVLPQVSTAFAAYST